MRTGILLRTDQQQADLYDPAARTGRERQRPARAARRAKPVCARCRAREARYGFRDEELLEAPRTLCFDCFRMEIIRRQERAEQLARARHATQLELPLAETLDEINRRRRRAQIAARHALGI